MRIPPVGEEVIAVTFTVFGQRNNLLWNELEIVMKLVMNDVEKLYFSSLRMELQMLLVTSEYSKHGGK